MPVPPGRLACNPRIWGRTAGVSPRLDRYRALTIKEALESIRIGPTSRRSQLLQSRAVIKQSSPRTPLLVITPCRRVLSATTVYHDTSEYVEDSSCVNTEDVAPMSYLSIRASSNTRVNSTTSMNQDRTVIAGHFKRVTGGRCSRATSARQKPRGYHHDIP